MLIKDKTADFFQVVRAKFITTFTLTVSVVAVLIFCLHLYIPGITFPSTLLIIAFATSNIAILNYYWNENSDKKRKILRFIIAISFYTLLLIFVFVKNGSLVVTIGLEIVAIIQFIILWNLTDSVEQYEPLSERYYFIGLVVVVALGFILRFWNLDILFPYADEYAHLLAAKDFFQTGSFSYTRAPLVTWSVILFQWIGHANGFYGDVFWGRLPGVIVGTLTAIPIYFLGKRISNSTGLIAAFLWATSPWAIGVSKTVREYTYYPAIVLFANIIILQLFELIIDFKRSDLYKIILRALFLACLLVYAFLSDSSSTLKVTILVVISSILCILIIHNSYFLKVYRKHKWVFYSGIILFLLLSVILLLYVNDSGQTTLTKLRFVPNWLMFFFSPMAAPMHWWSDLIYFPISIFLIFLGIVHAISKKMKAYLFPLLTFAVFLSSYSLFFTRYVRPRYIFYAEPFFVILIAVAVLSLVEMVRKMPGLYMRLTAAIVTMIFFFQVFNWANIIYPATSSTEGYNKVTDEFHDPIGNLMPFLEKTVTPNDVFITTTETGLLRLDLGVSTERIVYDYDYTDPNRFAEVTDMIKTYPNGLMVLDYRRNGYWAPGYPLSNFNVGGKLVRLVFNENGFEVYQW